MSRKLTLKKSSTNKYRQFKISPLIPVMALIEAIILIGITTFAWFTVSQEKEANTGIITVDADSGLDIDFKNANYNDEINIWDYVEDDFKFEPVTSLDGRNVFIPTSGTFNSTNTNSMIFRDGTINDINTKYLDVDFMLTNTTNSDMDVFLSNDSVFKVWDGNNQKNSRALRLAFYKNDGNHGKVDSAILTNTNNENAALERLTHKTTVYFNKPSRWSTVYAYMWKSENGQDYAAVSWPGSIMTRVAGTVYSYTFSNTSEYTKIIFSNGEKNNPIKYTSSTASTYTQTQDLIIADGHLYEGSAAVNSTGTQYNTKTVYFVKPSSWSTVYAHAFKQSGSSTSFTSWPGDECTYLGADIYSYTFPQTYEGNNMGAIVFNNNSTTLKTNDLIATDGLLYYFTYNGTSGACSSMQYSERTVYFYNSQNFDTPYAKLKAANGHVAEVAMTNLSSGVFYVTVPSFYNQVAFEDGAGQTTNSKYTRYYNVTDGYMYRPKSSSSTGWTMDSYSYSDYASDGNYAVISPGVSAGFQRSYTPVIDADPVTGKASQVVPAFADSLDNYIKSSGNEMFSLAPGEMIDLSMIVWLEGTDSDCTAPLYAGKQIQLYLVFSTTNVERDIDHTPLYTYRFYDKTREIWTSDRISSGDVSIAPVMQLYDATDKRGYLMHASSVSNVYNEGKGQFVDKIDMWECTAPASIFTSNHDIYYRRVDPYNEDEVWNYWHPGPSAGITDAASLVSGKTYISFTAFADGAPASTTQDSTGIPGNTSVLNAANSASTPAKSCGGLWGTYETTLLTAYDGSNGGWLARDNAVLTLRYTYRYNSGQTMQIEYKASGPFEKPYNTYFFVVPKTLYNNNNVTTYTIHRFWGFNNKFAMNILERNGNMSFATTCSPTITNSKLSGYYLWLSQSYGSNNIDQMWFGTKLSHVHLSTKNENGNNDIMNGANFKAHVWGGSAGTKDIYFYNNNTQFTYNSKFNSYVIIAPSGSTGLQLQRCNSSYNFIYNYSQREGYSTPTDLDIANNSNFIAKTWNSTVKKPDSNNNYQDTINTAQNNDTYSGWPTVPAYWYTN